MSSSNTKLVPNDSLLDPDMQQLLSQLMPLGGTGTPYIPSPKAPPKDDTPETAPKKKRKSASAFVPVPASPDPGFFDDYVVDDETKDFIITEPETHVSTSLKDGSSINIYFELSMTCAIAHPEVGEGDPSIHMLIPDKLLINIRIDGEEPSFHNFQLYDHQLIMYINPLRRFLQTLLNNLAIEIEKAAKNCTPKDINELHKKVFSILYNILRPHMNRCLTSKTLKLPDKIKAGNTEYYKYQVSLYSRVAKISNTDSKDTPDKVIEYVLKLTTFQEKHPPTSTERSFQQINQPELTTRYVVSSFTKTIEMINNGLNEHINTRSGKPENHFYIYLLQLLLLSTEKNTKITHFNYPEISFRDWLDGVNNRLERFNHRTKRLNSTDLSYGAGAGAGTCAGAGAGAGARQSDAHNTAIVLSPDSSAPKKQKATGTESTR